MIFPLQRVFDSLEIILYHIETGKFSFCHDNHDKIKTKMGLVSVQIIPQKKGRSEASIRAHKKDKNQSRIGSARLFGDGVFRRIEFETSQNIILSYAVSTGASSGFANGSRRT